MANQPNVDHEGFLPVSKQHSFRLRRGSESPSEDARPVSKLGHQLIKDLARDESTDMEVEKILESGPNSSTIPDAPRLRPVDNPIHISDMIPDEEMTPILDPGAESIQAPPPSDSPALPTLMQTILEALPRVESQSPTSPAVPVHGSPPYRRNEATVITCKVDGVLKEYNIEPSPESEQIQPSGSRYFIDLDHDSNELREQQLLADLAYLEWPNL